jgi:pentapeptide MXKDX repeat protein
VKRSDPSPAAVTFRLEAHLIAGIELCRAQLLNRNQENSMKKFMCKLMAMCFLTVSLTAFGQSGDTMKQDSMKPDTTKQDQMKKDDMAKDKKASKTKTKTKTDKTKSSDMKKDDTMKHGDTMKQN